MSKILKIERQPWMPKTATHYAVNVSHDACHYYFYKPAKNGGCMILNRGKWRRIDRDIESIKSRYDYLHEIQDAPTTD